MKDNEIEIKWATTCLLRFQPNRSGSLWAERGKQEILVLGLGDG